MKHTDFLSKTRAIKAQEYKELYKAVEAHGGLYEWDFESGVEYPIIASNINCILPNSTDVAVKSVAIVDGRLVIRGEEKEYGEDVYFEPEDVFTGHLSSIIDFIDDTDCVDDVTTKQEFIMKHKDGIYICNDGFVWLILTVEEARNMWCADVFPLYRLYDDDSEGAVGSEYELEEAIEKGQRIAIEVGYVHSQQKLQ